MPYTMLRACSPATSPLTGQPTITRLNPTSSKYGVRASGVLITPLASRTISTPQAFQGTAVMSCCRDQDSMEPFTEKPLELALMSPPPATMNRIEFEQMCCGGGISAWIIHVHKLDPRSSPQGTKDEPSDATKPVDSNSHRTARTRGEVLPINLF